MIIRIFIILSIIILNIFNVNCLKFDNLTFDLSLRYRFEIWDGMNAKNFGDDSPNAIGNLNDKIMFQRIIAGITYQKGDNLKFALHFQDSRAFGWSLKDSEYPDLFKIRKQGYKEPYYKMNPNEEFFEIYDANIEIDSVIDNLSLKIGRQKIFYGDNRIFGPGDWGNTGRWTWDALKLSYKFNNNFIDFWVGGTKIHDPNKISFPFFDTEFFGIGFYSHFAISKSYSIEPFYAFKKNGSADYIKDLDINKHWFGARLVDSNIYNFDYDITYSREFGSEIEKTISAYGFFARLGYKFNFLPMQPLLSLRFSYASGGKKNDDKIYTFEPAFGSQDKFYGRMNIVSWSNLDDREIVLELFPLKHLWIELKYNIFFIPEPKDIKIVGTLQLIENKSYLGSEIDFFMRYNHSKNLQIFLVSGIFFTGDVKPINDKQIKTAFWLAGQIVYLL